MEKLSQPLHDEQAAAGSLGSEKTGGKRRLSCGNADTHRTYYRKHSGSHPAENPRLAKAKAELQEAQKELGKIAFSLFTKSGLLMNGGITPEDLSKFSKMDDWRVAEVPNADRSANTADWARLTWDKLETLCDREDELAKRRHENSSKQGSLSAQVVRTLDAADMHIFGDRPMTDNLFVVTCEDCRKTVLKSVFSEHLRRCPGPAAALPRRQADEKGTKKGGRKKKDLEETEPELSQVAGKKRNTKPEAAGDGDVAADAKAAKPKKPKGAPAKRIKGPVDYDKHCGVFVETTGMPCTRSLTCKTHSMGAKRSVQGRSQTYDTLLRLHRPHLAPAPKPPPKPKVTKVPKATATMAKQNTAAAPCVPGKVAGAANTSESEVEEKAAGAPPAADADMDTADQEIDEIIKGLAYRFPPEPLTRRPVYSLRRQYETLRPREILFEALHRHTISMMNAMQARRQAAQGGFAGPPAQPGGPRPVTPLAVKKI